MLLQYPARGKRLLIKSQSFTWQRPISTTREGRDNGTVESTTLPDGRTIAFTICGAERGHPIFYLHGFPGSGHSGRVFNAPASALGATIISPERPGVGLSTAQPGRALLGHADDIQHLAKYLGHDKWSIMGVSGGGPYALACAYAQPAEKVNTVALVGGMGPADISLRRMGFAARVACNILHYTPGIFRFLLHRLTMRRLRMNDDMLLGIIQKQISSPYLFTRTPDKDREILANSEFMRLLVESARQHFRQGVDAFVQEGKILTSDFGFTIDQIERPVKLWYGRQDINVPPIMGEEIAERLKYPELRFEDETHLSLVVNCREKIVKDILDSA